MKTHFLLLTVSPGGAMSVQKSNQWMPLLNDAFRMDGTGEIVAWQLQMLFEVGRNTDGEIEALANPIAQHPDWQLYESEES